MKSSYIVKTIGLGKTYGKHKVLHDVNLNLEAGKIYGLIGQNGAGKTTLMRMLAGLAFPTVGDIDLFGQSNTSKLSEERARLGCMIENPGLIPYMSAKQNLSYHRKLRGIPSKTLEQELLEYVGLKEVGNKKVKDFSLGMKQRLGIAIALIGNPEFLILDEPINGLDPIGVVEVRELILRLCKEKHMTILLSSHNLPELYQVATDYIFIHNGTVVKSITLAQLEESCQHHINIVCDKPEQLVSVFEQELGTQNYKVLPDHTIRLYDYIDEKEKVAKVIAENGIITTNFSIEGDTLENYFISIVEGKSSQQ